MIAEYSKNLDGEYSVDYTERKKEAVWTVTMPVLKLEFIYTLKKNVLIPTSTLYCNVYLEKNSNNPYTVYQIIDYLGLEDYHCYTFSYIESEERLCACFNALKGFLNANLQSVERLAISGFDFKEKRLNETKRVLKDNEIDSGNDFAIHFTLENQIARYTDFPAYKLFLKGQYEKSLKLYYKLKKKNTLYDYEIKLIGFMEKLMEKGERYEAITLETASLLKAEKYGESPQGYGSAILLSVLLVYLILLIPFSVIIVFLFKYLYSGTVLGPNEMQILFSIFLMPLIPAVFIGIAFSDKIYLRKNKNNKDAQNFYYITFSPKSNAFAKFVCIIMSVVTAFIFSVLMIAPQIKCYEEYMVCNISEKDFQFDYQRYNYSDIKEIYKVDGIYNEYTGKIIDRQSFVIRFSNGDVNTDSYLEFYESEQQLLPQITKFYKGKIKYAKTNLDVK